MDSTNSSRPLHPRQQARHLLVQILYAWHITQESLLDLAVEWRLQADAEGLKYDQAYLEDMLTYIDRHHEELDQILSTVASRALEEIQPVERAVLWLSTTEMVYRLDIPYKVVINEGLELTKCFGSTEAYRFVNGILDRLASQYRRPSV